MTDHVINETDTVKLEITWLILGNTTTTKYAISGSELRNAAWGLDYLIGTWIDKTSNEIHLNGLADNTPILVFKYLREMLEQAFIQSLETELTIKIDKDHSINVKIEIDKHGNHKTFVE
ncbi:MAG: hypothetical protein H7Z73_10440 [Candidatus Saccharibacteria bacterium]|nr:hypothetical protein [Moraxellaceae bacterium]